MFSITTYNLTLSIALDFFSRIAGSVVPTLKVRVQWSLRSELRFSGHVAVLLLLNINSSC